FTAVGDHHDHPFVEVAGKEFHGTPGRGVPAGVVQQFPHHTADPRAVGDRHQLFGDRVVDLDLRVGKPALVDRVAQQRRQVDLGEVQLERATLELGDRDDL